MKLKILVAISLFFFFSTVVSIVTAGLVLRELRKNNIIGQNDSINASNSLKVFGSQTDNSQITLSSEEVAKHNNPGDCWTIIDKKVYNITGFLVSHPGGANTITPYCGKDTSNAFKTKDKNPPSNHSQFANGLLTNYYLGSLGETIIGQPIARTMGVPTGAVPTSKPINQKIMPTISQQNSQTQTPSNVTLTVSEVAMHNTLQNCWIIISGNVYDVTSYIVQHPGGAQAITNTCGTDATTAFQTKGGRGNNHSQTANNLLSNYLIGSLGSSVSTNPSSTGNTNTSGTNQTTQTNQTNSPSNSSGSSGTLPSAVSVKYPGATIKKQNIEDDGTQELEIIYNGQCIKVKTNTSGQITNEENC